MRAKGLFTGNSLWIDLSNSEIKREPLDTSIAQKYIGGWGMNARLAYDLIMPEMDAYDPGMPLIFGCGVFNGTPCPGTPKSFLTTKDKASGTVVTAVGSLFFGSMLRWSGYDHLIIRGKAEKPVYLKIIDNEIALVDASDLWGCDVNETTRKLKNKYGEQSSVACIGSAGEKEVPISMVFNDYFGTFGRSFGGNFGSKNLKAVVIAGSQGTKLADRNRFMKTVNELAEKAKNDPLRDKWATEGLYFVFPLWVEAGYFTFNNWREGFPRDKALEIFGNKHFQRVKQRSIACPSCNAPDKFYYKFKGGEMDGFEMMIGTPIDPALSYGTRNGVGDFDKACWLFAESNRHGIDAMTLSGTISFAEDLYKQGVITKEDTGGIEIKPGFETVKHLLELTAANEGFGALLAEGFHGIIKRFGHEEDSCQIKGTEPDFDARACLGVEVFGSVTNPRGAHDMPVGGMTVAKGRKPEFIEKIVSKAGYVPEDAWNRVFQPEGFNVARLTAYYENWATVLNCLGICFRMQNSALYNKIIAAELYSAGTGIEKNPEELMKDAERAYNLYKMLNVREGFGRKDDRFPERWYEPLKMSDREDMTLQDYFGYKKLTREDIEALFDEYYEEKGWDKKSGIPTKAKLTELGLETEYGS